MTKKLIRRAVLITVDVSLKMECQYNKISADYTVEYYPFPKRMYKSFKIS